MSKQFVFTTILMILAVLVLLVVVEGSSPLSSKSTSHHAVVSTSSSETQQNDGGYEIIRDKLIFSGRWRSLTSRLVRMKNRTKEVDFEIFNQLGKGCVLIFAWDSKSKTATLIREYNPGPNKILNGIAAGLVEADKHGSCYETAARHELEEETNLSGGAWFRLLHEGKAMAMDKYMMSEVVAYLVVDARKVENPRPLDYEEEIEIVDGVSVEGVMEIIKNGNMNCICAFASLLAIEKLRELGEI
mmetsp:Transcript_19333/g.28610  ORF Transcript_19333/g.28610 Transcript_19333/m.28610 type:complete len:244 (-) Transcript_19333:15-746(-)